MRIITHFLHPNHHQYLNRKKRISLNSCIETTIDSNSLLKYLKFQSNSSFQKNLTIWNDLNLQPQKIDLKLNLCRSVIVILFIVRNKVTLLIQTHWWILGIIKTLSLSISKNIRSRRKWYETIGMILALKRFLRSKK